jgi:hypothetical protein
VAVGEHLGYLFTGLWSAPAGVALIQSDLLHPLFGIAGLLLAPLFVLGSLEKRDCCWPAPALQPVPVTRAWAALAELDLG